MLVRALLPDILQHATGGNLFNQRVLTFLETVATVDRQVITKGQQSTTPAAVTLIDSLLLAAAADASQEQLGCRLLLAHYLHLFEPRCRHSAEAERERRLLSNVDGVITTSVYCRDVLTTEGFADHQLAVVTPGLAPAYAAEVEQRPAGPPRILTVSTLLEGKGLRQLLSVLETLTELDWTWELAGDPGLDPEFSAEFQQRLEASPVAQRSRLHGAVEPDRMIELYDRSTLLVLPSQFETCSMATMEAMARGLPVIAYRIGGLPERIPAACAELLAPPGDRQQLAERLQRLLVDPTAGAAYGHKNRQASRRFPSWEDSGAALWSFLRRQHRLRRQPPEVMRELA